MTKMTVIQHQMNYQLTDHMPLVWRQLASDQFDQKRTPDQWPDELLVQPHCRQQLGKRTKTVNEKIRLIFLLFIHTCHKGNTRVFKWTKISNYMQSGISVRIISSHCMHFFSSYKTHTCLIKKLCIAMIYDRCPAVSWLTHQYRGSYCHHSFGHVR